MSLLFLLLTGKEEEWEGSLFDITRGLNLDFLEENINMVT